MSGFNENTAMVEQAQGVGEEAKAPVQPLAIGTPSEPSVPAGATALAWWDAPKYYWRRNASGNGCHLAPQDSYVDDVLDRTDHYMSSIAKDLGEDEYDEFDEAAKLRLQMIQSEDAFDTSGIEGNSVRREVLNRLIIARKICGVSAVSAEHRVINELSRETGDVEKLKGDPEGFYASDVEKRERWGQKAIRLEYIAKAIADGEVIPTSDTAFADLLGKRIQRSLYDDAVEHGNKLKRPQQQQRNADAKAPSKEELLALTA
jgi:hypothetical protein